MNVLLLTKVRLEFVGENIKNSNDYLMSDFSYDGWRRGFERADVSVDTFLASSLFLPSSLAFEYPKVYTFLFKSLYGTPLRHIDRYLLSKKIERYVKKNDIDVIFTELNHFLTINSIRNMQKQGVIVSQWVGVFPESISKDTMPVINSYDFLWSPGDFVDEFKAYDISADKMKVIYSAYNEKYMYYDYDGKYKHNICFIGGISSSHTQRIEILEAVAKEFGDDFAFYGYGIENLGNNSPLRRCYKGWADAETIRKIYSSSKIALNLTLDSFERMKSGINMRCFEIPACKGSLQLIKDMENVKQFFDDGKEIVLFKDVDDLIKKIAFYLVNDDERNAIVKNAFTRNKDNTFDKRASKIIGYLKGGVSGE